VKLLFDENLSNRLVRALQDVYPDSAPVRDLGLEGAEDRLIWKAAAEGGYLLASRTRTSTSAVWFTVRRRRSSG
jgi:predicted nuclease of predicted toxin-antitoxin system